MLSEKMEQALEEQLNHELFSGYLYLSMAAYFESVSMPGMAKWMKAQADEERMHGMRFFDFVVDRGGRVTLEAIAKPESQWASPLAAFEAAYAHEQKVTGLIHKLVEMAKEEGDAETGEFLQWFVSEQEEEEESVDEVVQNLRAAKDAPDRLLELDSLLGARRTGGE